MPKHRRIPRVLRRSQPATPHREILPKQLTLVQRDKENSLSSIAEPSASDPLTYMKIEVDDVEIDPVQQLEFNESLDLPLKIEHFEALECSSIKAENVDTESESTLAGTCNNDLNILIEWALNLQFDHSKQCSGRLYPCKKIFDNFRCKIVVLNCTVCKKCMLHTLKDWAMFE